MPPKPPPSELPVAEIAYGTNVRELDDSTPAFRELVESVKTHGVLEPLLVRATPPGPQDHAYELVAGYRRIAAARAAGLKTVPVRVLDINDTERSEIQLLENLLRKDLTPMEEARGIHEYSAAAGAKPKEVAARIHKSETYVRERLRLLNLVPEAQTLLGKGEMDVAHAVLVATLPPEGQQELVKGEDGYRDTELTGPMDAYFRTEVRQMAELCGERELVRATAKAAKFPVCPKEGCGLPPERQAYGSTRTNGKPTVVMDSAEHIWNLASGEVKPRTSVIDANPTIARERAERKAERYDRSVNPAVLLQVRPWELAAQLIKSAADGVSMVKISSPGGGSPITMEVEFGDNAPEELDRKLPAYFGVTLYPTVAKEGHVTQAVAGPSSGKDRAATLKLVRELATGIPGLPAMEAPPPQLEGTVAEVVARLGGYTPTKDGGRHYERKKKGEEEWRENRVFLQLLRDTEAATKNRGSVLDAIDLMLGADTPTRPQSDY
ncbi:MAG TPA: ParB/RepB/Spo0J family partition protein [Thermoplasmata archaeon]|nr:ParB/RepB/Spo0J family partition protein [Thermoplasmata archaeon]